MRVVSFTMKRLTLEVRNQKEEHNCHLFVLADMLGVVHSMWEHRVILISPQMLMDRGLNDVTDVGNFIIVHGLEEASADPCHRVVDPSEGNQLQQGVPRYRLYWLHHYRTQDEIRDKISDNFYHEGYQYPVVGILRLGRLVEKEFSKRFGIEGRFFAEVRPTLDEEEAKKAYGAYHAVLIVGMYNTHRNPRRHYFEVKNTHGTEWGNQGFANVAIDLFEHVYLPVYNPRGDNPYIVEE
nr:hypothetical protein [Tanacetum cinerariifolium]